MTNPVATIKINNNRTIRIELLPELAPNTVRSFIYLAKNHVYDNYAISRIVPDYVIDMSYTAFNKDIAKYLIKNEAIRKNEEGYIAPDLGTICMGGYEDGIAGGEFFFPLLVSPKIDGNYPVFGKILEGTEYIKEFEGVETKKVFLDKMPGISVSEPLEPIVIEKIEIETFGEDYEKPEVLTEFMTPPYW